MGKGSASKFTPHEQESEAKKLLTGTLSGAAAALIFTLVLTFTVSAAVLAAPDPDALSALAAYAVTGISLLAGGVTAVRVSCGSILSSLSAGGIYTLLAFCVHLVLTAKSGTGALSLLFLLFPVISMLGGYIARPREKRRGQKFKKR
ncbi:MAG: hypothetical protein IJ391_07025 [Clostridia bacterium]|nr:hypothetical protein [Clostridia bacterium]